MKSLEELLNYELLELLDAEVQIQQVIPKLMQAAISENLQAFLKKQTKEIKKSIERLQQALELIGAKEKRHCHGMEGLLNDGNFFLKIKEKSLVKDAAVVDMVSKIISYQIASYNSIQRYAKLLYMDQIETLLAETVRQITRAGRSLKKMVEGTFFTEGIITKATLFETS